MTTHSKFYKRHMAELATGTYSEGSIQGLRKALHNADRKACGYSVGVTAANVSQYELDCILDRIAEVKPRIAEKQAAKGLAWLRKTDRTPKGTIRKTSPFGDPERHVLANFSHFTLDRMVNIGDRLSFFVPCYRCHATDGTSFAYWASAWQSGGGIEVTR